VPPAIAYGGAFIFLVAAFIVAWGLLTVYRLSLKPLLLGLASLFSFSVGGLGFSLGRPLAAIGDALKSLAESIDHGLAEAVLASEHGIVWLWHALAKQAEWLGNLLGDLAETFEAKFRAWYLAFPPLAAIWLAVRAVRELPALWQAVHGAKASVTNVTEKVYRQGAHITNVTKTYVTRVAHEAVAATTGAITAPLPWVRGRFGDLEGELAGLRQRIRRLEKPLLGAGVIAVIGAALARLGIGWARCPSVGKIGKRACGINPDLLESLLADTLLIAGTLSLVEFAHEMVAVTDTAVRPIQRFWRAG